MCSTSRSAAMRLWRRKRAREAPPQTFISILALRRNGLRKKKRGTAADIVVMLALVIEEDADTGKLVKLPGIAPSFVVETSCNPAQNRHFHFVYDRALPPQEAKELAELAYRKCGGDTGNKDIVHPWRIPGTLNYPTLKKLARGRPPEPQPVRIIGGTGEPVSVKALRAALEAMPDLKPQASATNGECEWQTGGETDRDAILARLPVSLRADIEFEPEAGKRSEHCASVMWKLFHHGLTDDEVEIIANGSAFAAKFDERGDLHAEIERERAGWEAKAGAKAARPEAPAEETGIKAAIQRLAALDDLEYEAARNSEAKQLKIRVGVLDKEVAEAKAKGEKPEVKAKKARVIERLNKDHAFVMLNGQAVIINRHGHGKFSYSRIQDFFHAYANQFMPK